MTAAAAFRAAKRAVVGRFWPLLAAASRGRARLAAKDRAYRGALRPRIDAGHRGAPDRRRPAAEISRQHIRRGEQARRQRQSRHRCCRKGRARWLDHSGSASADRSPSTPCCSRDCPTIRTRTSRPLRSWSPNRACSRSIRALGVNSVAELVALLRKNPGKYNFASIGNGSLSHLAMEAIAIKAGAELVHVPYPSSPQAITAVIRNDAQMACLPAISVTPQVGNRRSENSRRLNRQALALFAGRTDAEGEPASMWKPMPGTA